MADYDGGRVFLRVTPSFTNVQRLIAAEAARWGNDAGKAFRDQFNRQAQSGPRPNLGPSAADAAKQGEDAGKAYGGGFRSGLGAGGPIPVPGPGRAPSARQGEESGGAYADAFRRKLEAATRSLPPVKIGVATSAAEQDLRDLRQDLESLTDKRVGVDIDSAAALVEVERIQAELRRLSENTTDVQIRTDATAANAQIEALHAELKRLAGEKTTVDVDVRSNEGSLATRVRAALERAQAALPRIDIDASTAPADLEVARLRGRIEALGNRRIGVDISAADALAQIERLQEKLTRLATESPDVRVNADAAAAAAALAEVQAQADRLNGKRVRLDVDSSTLDSFSGRLVLMGTLIGSLLPALVPIGGAAIVGIGAIGAASSTAIPAVGALILGLHGVGEALKAMGKVDEESGALAQQSAQKRAQAAQQQQSAARALEGAELSLQNTRAQAATAAVNAARQIADAQERVRAAEENATRATEQNARRVVDAQDALTQARDEAARSAEQSTRRIAGAERSLADAQDAAQRATEQSTQRVSDARENAAEVAARAASDVETALRRQEDAERSLSDAQDDARAAQEDLTRARQDAEEQLQDLANQVESGALRQRQSVLDVADAQDELNKTIADPSASERDKAQAQLRYEQAVQQLEELQVRNERLTAQQAEASAAGVEGSDRVRDAQQRIVDAVRAREDAERTAAEAGQTVVDTRLGGAKAIADSEKAITDAQSDAARQAADSSRAVADAQQSLTDATDNARLASQDSVKRVADAEQSVTDALATQEQSRIDGLQRIADAQQSVADAVVASGDQQRQSAFSISQAESSLEGARLASAAAATSSADTASAAMQNLQTAMGKLSPVQQTFADFLYGLKPQLKGLQDASAAGLLPGLQAGLEAVLPVFPLFEDILRNVGGALGDLGRQAGEALASPTWRPFLDFLRDQGGPLLSQFGDIIGNLATALLPGLVAAFGPLAGPVLSILEQLTGRFAEFLLTAQDNPAFQAFIDYVIANAPVVADFLGALGNAFVTIVQSMAPFGPVILGIITNLLNFVAAIPPGVLEAVALAVIGISAAFAILGPIIGFVSGIVAAVSAGVPILGAVIAALGGPVTIIIAVIVALAAALIAAYQHSETFRDIVNAAFGAVRDFIVDVVWEKGLKPAFEALVDFMQNVIAPAATWLWQNILQPAFEGIGNAVKWAWEKVIQPALEALVWYWQNVLQPVLAFLWHNIFEPAFEGIGVAVKIAWEVIKLALDALKFYWENVLAPALAFLWHNIFEPAFKGIGDAVSWAWNNVIKPVLDALRSFFDTTLGPAIQTGVTAFTNAWNTMKKAAADPINFVIREVYGGTDENKGIRGLFTKVAKAVGSEARLPEIKELAYATGGSVRGPGTGTSDDIPAWLSNGEHVWTAAEVARAGGHRAVEALRNAAMRGDLRDAMPRFAKGGIVDLGKWFQSIGANVSENPSFGGVHPVHKGRGHYEGRAIDVNHGAGTSAQEQSFFDKYADALKQAGWTVFWRVAGHFNHLHAEAPTQGFEGNIPGTGGFLDKIGDAISSAADFLNPFDDLLGKLKDKVLSSDFAQLGAGAVTKGVGLIKDWAGSKLSSVTDALGITGGIDPEYDGAEGSLAPAAARAAAQKMLPGGWSWADLNSLWTKESGWDWSADNPGSSAYGIPQALPGSKMASAGRDWKTNAVTQIKWGLGYIDDRYGNSQAAWAHSKAKNWYADGGPVTVKPTLYDQGGWLQPGMTLVQNATGRPEPVFTGAEFDAMSARGQRQERLAPLLERLIDVAGDGNDITGTGLSRLAGALEDQPRQMKQLTRQGV